MRFLACISALVTAAACAGTDTSDVPPGRLRVLADHELIGHLRQISGRLTGDTIHLYSPGFADSLSPMSGLELDTAYYRFFRPFYPQMTSDRALFAVGYFDVVERMTAYVLRVPSLYSSTALALWVRHEAEEYWLPPRIVADGYGDAEWSFRHDAWLVDRDGDGDRDLIQRRTDWVDIGETVYRDSLKWTFWQEAFDQWGWSRDITDSADVLPFRLSHGR